MFVFPGHLSLAKTHPSPALIQPPCSLLLPKPYYSNFLACFSQLFSIIRIFLELSLLFHFAITEAVTELDCSRSPYFPLASGGPGWFCLSRSYTSWTGSGDSVTLLPIVFRPLWPGCLCFWLSLSLKHTTHTLTHIHTHTLTHTHTHSHRLLCWDALVRLSSFQTHCFHLLTPFTLCIKSLSFWLSYYLLQILWLLLVTWASLQIICLIPSVLWSAHTWSHPSWVAGVGHIWKQFTFEMLVSNTQTSDKLFVFPITFFQLLLMPLFLAALRCLI